MKNKKYLVAAGISLGAAAIIVVQYVAAYNLMSYLQSQTYGVLGTTIDDSQTNIPLEDISVFTGYPKNTFTARITATPQSQSPNDEYISVLDIDGNDLIVERGKFGSAPQKWRTGSYILYAPTMRDIGDLERSISIETEVMRIRLKNNNIYSVNLTQEGE